MPHSQFPSKAEKSATEACNYPELGKINLHHLREQVQESLKLIGRNQIFSEYTLHDMSHIDAMLASVDYIIPEPTKEIMSAADWLLIVCACYFHDFGLIVTEEEWENRNQSGFQVYKENTLFHGDEGIDYKTKIDSLNNDEAERFLYQEFVRANHAERIELWINQSQSTDLGICHTMTDAISEILDGMVDIFKQDLATVCRSHHESDLNNLDKYKIRRAYGADEQLLTNIHYAALILRTADLMHITKNRVPSILFKLINPSNPISQEHWAMQSAVRAVLPVKSNQNIEHADSFEVQALFKDDLGYFGLQSYLKWAETEIARCQEWAVNAKETNDYPHFYPWKYIDKSQVEAKGFDTKQYQFRLDRERILNLLTGHTLYNNSSVAIRELLQNSLDAIRLRLHEDPNGKAGKLNIHWNKRERTISIKDNGTGISHKDIEKYLLNVGVSKYQDPDFKKKNPDFSSISRFGIGILSTFMISDHVEITSITSTESSGRKLILPSVVQNYLLREIPREELKDFSDSGTEVKLLVRKSTNLQSVLPIIQHWILYPNCEVKYTDDEGNSEIVGYDNPADAYNKLTKDSKSFHKNWLIDDIQIRPSLSEGVDAAYITFHHRYSKVWSLVPSFIDDEYTKIKRSIPAVCIEGIRVTNEIPQPERSRRSHGSTFVAINCKGKSIPQTNVARSGLDENENDFVGKIFFDILSKHCTVERDRLTEIGTGKVKAVSSIRLMAEQLGLKTISGQSCRYDDIEIWAVEDENEQKFVSKNDLHTYPHIHTVDSTTLDSLEDVLGDVGVNMSTSSVIKTLRSTDSVDFGTPRLLGNDINPVLSLGIKSIKVDVETKLVDIQWSSSCEAWTFLNELIDDEFGASGRYPNSKTVLFAPKNWNGCNKAELELIDFRDCMLYLPSSMAVELYHHHPSSRRILALFLVELINNSHYSYRDTRTLDSARQAKFEADLIGIGISKNDAKKYASRVVPINDKYYAKKHFSQVYETNAW